MGLDEKTETPVTQSLVLQKVMQEKEAKKLQEQKPIIK